MPSRLKSFELHGYKTFASRTEFIFADGVTAIVGPNGSGKSNIADAIRWVLGEQSFGLLRAKRTEDMIFAGSESRPRAGMASATILFDNSDGWLPIDFTEVGITRRAYRDGDNEYLLNGQRVRLKDVSELLAQSGLAERTYTVIGQGLVDAALSLKAEERRRLFEEAAGIGLHRTRREEALRRLESTRRNLERVQDILVELQPRIRSLERQARRAMEYDQVRADLKNLLREWYGYHWHKAQAEVTEALEQARMQEASLEKARQDQLNFDQQLAMVREQSQTLRNRISGWNQKLSIAYSHKERLAREYAVTEERIRLLLRQKESLALENIRLQEEVTLYQEQVANSTVDIDNLASELLEAQTNKAEVERDVELLRTRILALETELKREQQKLSELEMQQGILQSRLNEREAVISGSQTSQDEVSSRIYQAEDELKSFQAIYGQLKLQRQTNEVEINKINAELIVVREDISKLEKSRTDSLENRSLIQARLARLKAQLDVLIQAEDNLSGYAEGARNLLQAMRAARISGGRGALSNFIEVPPEYENAIASALGEYLGALVVTGWEGVDDAFKILETGSVRGAMLPLEAITPSKHWKIDPSKIPVEKDALIGIASEIVHVGEELRPIVDLLLGQVIIVKDRSIAQRLMKAGNWPSFPTMRIVTLKGEVFYTNGPVLSASTSQGVLGRPRQRQEIEKEISIAETELKRIDELLRNINDDLERLRNKEIKLDNLEREAGDKNASTSREIHKIELSIEKIQRNISWQHEQLEAIRTSTNQAQLEATQLTKDLIALRDEIQVQRGLIRDKFAELEAYSLEEIQAKVSYWQTQTAVAERALQDAEDKKHEREGILSRAKDLVAAQHTQTEAIATEVGLLVSTQQTTSEELNEITIEINELVALLTPAEADLKEADTSLNAWLTKDTEYRQSLSLAEHQYAQARINLSRRQESLDSLRRRIEDDFGLVAFEYAEAVSGPKPLPLDGMVEELPKVEQLAADMDENVQRQRALLRRMGPVNPEAQIEYQQVKDRFDFLTDQVSDLHKAETDIQEVIAELDLLMEREFRKTFDAVAQEFRQIFTRLFGGGSARLVLTEPEYMTDTGIDIEARLPGRREQGLSLLSGGERSLTATALVFALLRISPTPFCILDEVDAMLDEANVGRFRELLSELSGRTQFIIITHNRNTVQAASVIYGVTMGRDSSSQVISLKLDELTEEYGVKKE